MLKKTIIFIQLLVFPALFSVIICENILVLSTVPSGSHEIWMRVLAKGLASQHNITFLSTEPGQNLGPNVHTIFMEEVHNELERLISPTELIDLNDVTPIEELKTFNEYCVSPCSGGFKSKGLQQLLNYPSSFKFDLVVYDYTCGPCFLFLLDKLNYPPVVGVTAFGNPPYTLQVVGGHHYYAYVPYYGLYHSSQMNFWQKIKNMFYHIMNLRSRSRAIKDQDDIVRKHIKTDFPYLGDLEKKVSLAFVNTHPIVDFPEPLPPNVIPVGGLQIEKPKPLSNDLEEFIQKSVKGVILFCLGTNVRSDYFGDERIKDIIKAIEQFPDYNFLWKFEADSLPVNQPKNLLIRKFLPQNDILAHPRTKAFISHGGMLSSHEATWHGVPIIAIPFLADQHRNSHGLVGAGVAEIIQFKSLTTDELKGKLYKVLNDPKYRKNMELKSSIFRDQPERPIDRAVWWINWLMRNPSPEHIQSPVLKLGYIRSNLLDIFIIVNFILLLGGVLLCKIVNSCFKRKDIPILKRKLKST